MDLIICTSKGEISMSSCEVSTKMGKVKGKEEDGIFKWLGIPYAKKPLGDLRFRHAQPVEAWEGVIEAVEYPKKPLQGNFLMGNSAYGDSEDCLYLNVLSSNTETKKPVLVWIYGGAFIIGETSLNMYDGTSFAQKDVVFVSLNYRLGMLGGYDFSNLNGGDNGIDDNIFISDQVQALKWIHENIEFFGGDPENVTIMGESAGGTSVVNLMTVPEAEGLFQKVICESGVLGATVSPDVGNISMRLVLEHLGIEETEVEKIKDLSPEQLREASVWLMQKFTRYYPGIYLSGPVLGSLLPEYPLEAIKKGAGKGIKLLIGTNKDESTLFIDEENGNMCSSREEVERFLSDIGTSEEVKDRLNTLYSDYGSEKGLRDFMTDINFTYHSALAADYQSEYGDTYMYYFSYVARAAKMMKLGAFHMSEIPFAFDNVEQYDMAHLHAMTSKETLQYFTDIFHTAWVNFVKYGNPNGTEDGPWPKYNAKTKKVYQIDEECKVLEDPYRETVEVIGQVNLYH